MKHPQDTGKSFEHGGRSHCFARRTAQPSPSDCGRDGQEVWWGKEQNWSGPAIGHLIYFEVFIRWSCSSSLFISSAALFSRLFLETPESWNVNLTLIQSTLFVHFCSLLFTFVHLCVQFYQFELFKLFEPFDRIFVVTVCARCWNIVRSPTKNVWIRWKISWRKLVWWPKTPIANTMRCKLESISNLL